MQHDRETGQTSGDFLENVEAELRLRAGLELIRAVAGADGDGQRVAAGALHKLLHVLGTGVGESSAETLTSSSTPASVPSSASTTTP